MAQDENYEGTKINELEAINSGVNLDNASVLVVTQDNQYLVPMSVLIEHITNKISTP